MWPISSSWPTYLCLESQTCFTCFTMGIGPSFCTSEHYKYCAFLLEQLEQCSWETNPMVIQFRFRILKYKEILKYLNEYALFWDRIHRCIRPIVSIGLVPFYSGLYFSESSRVLTQLLVFLYCKCFWRGLKFVIGKLTGRCELQRICYNKKPGARRTLKIGKYDQ